MWGISRVIKGFANVICSPFSEQASVQKNYKPKNPLHCNQKDIVTAEKDVITFTPIFRTKVVRNIQETPEKWAQINSLTEDISPTEIAAISEELGSEIQIRRQSNTIIIEKAPKKVAEPAANQPARRRVKKKV